MIKKIISRKKKSHSTIKKKVGLFYKISIFLILIAFIPLFYFLVLVSTQAKSIDFITQEIREKLEESFGKNNVSLKNSSLGFTHYGTLKITLSEVKILYSQNLAAPEKKIFTAPILEAEFSLWDLLLMNFYPTKIRLIDSYIIVENLHKPSNQDQKNSDDLSTIIAAISSIQKNGSPIKNFEIENAKLMLKGKNSNNEILLKKSKISVLNKGDILQISSQNLISFDSNKSDVRLNSNCNIPKQGSAKCDLLLENFSPDAISTIDSRLVCQL